MKGTMLVKVEGKESESNNEQQQIYFEKLFYKGSEYWYSEIVEVRRGIQIVMQQITGPSRRVKEPWVLSSITESEMEENMKQGKLPMGFSDSLVWPEFLNNLNKLREEKNQTRKGIWDIKNWRMEYSEQIENTWRRNSTTRRTLGNYARKEAKDWKWNSALATIPRIPLSTNMRVRSACGRKRKAIGGENGWMSEDWRWFYSQLCWHHST